MVVQLRSFSWRKVCGKEIPYPLSLFIFVLVAEGLTRLVKKSIEIGDFCGFDVNERCKVDILQFTNDTLLAGEGS